AAVDLFKLTTLLFDAQGAQGIQAACDAGDFPHAVVNFDTAPGGETGKARPLLDNAARASSLELHVDVLELFEKLQQNLDTRLDSAQRDRKSTRLNSSHVSISYAVFC